MDSENYVCLEVVSAGIDPEEMTWILGVSPSEFWKVGDAWGRRSSPRGDNGWMLKRPWPQGSPVEIEVNGLLSSVPGLDDLSAVLLKQAATARISCIGYVANSTPDLYFAPALLARLGQLGLSLDVDLLLVGAN